MRIISSPSKQNPSNLTRFLCWSLASIRISFLNCTSPWPEFLDNLLTATSCPSGSLPLNKQVEGSLAIALKKPSDKFEACENAYALPCKRSQIHLVQAYYHQKSLPLQPWLLQDWIAGTAEFHFLPLCMSKKDDMYHFHRKIETDHNVEFYLRKGLPINMTDSKRPMEITSGGAARFWRPRNLL